MAALLPSAKTAVVSILFLLFFYYCTGEEAQRWHDGCKNFPLSAEKIMTSCVSLSFLLSMARFDQVTTLKLSFPPSYTTANSRTTFCRYSFTDVGSTDIKFDHDRAAKGSQRWQTCS